MIPLPPNIGMASKAAPKINPLKPRKDSVGCDFITLRTYLQKATLSFAYYPERPYRSLFLVPVVAGQGLNDAPYLPINLHTDQGRGTFFEYRVAVVLGTIWRSC
jgi:hypothetical protein